MPFVPHWHAQAAVRPKRPSNAWGARLQYSLAVASAVCLPEAVIRLSRVVSTGRPKRWPQGIDLGYTNGYTTGMKISISLPEAMHKEADAEAGRLKLSRSELIRLALREFLRHRREAKITESINRYIAKHGNELSAEDEAWLEHGRRTVLRTLEELEALPAPRSKRKRRAKP